MFHCVAVLPSGLVSSDETHDTDKDNDLFLLIDEFIGVLYLWRSFSIIAKS